MSEIDRGVEMLETKNVCVHQSPRRDETHSAQNAGSLDRYGVRVTAVLHSGQEGSCDHQAGLDSFCTSKNK